MLPLTNALKGEMLFFASFASRGGAALGVVGSNVSRTEKIAAENLVSK